MDFDMQDIVERLDYYFYSSFSNKDKLAKVIHEFRNIIEEEINNEQKNKSILNEFIKLINLIASTNCEPAVLILKNEDNKYDMYIFKSGVSVTNNEVFSSEEFMKKIRKEAINGFVIGDISPKDVLNFLKAYYLYRQKPEQDKSALNISYNYDKWCLEMTTIMDKFDGIEKGTSMNLRNVILYDDDALPYNLDYLDKYKVGCSNDFERILRDVCKDKYLGTSLSKVQGWW